MCPWIQRWPPIIDQWPTSHSWARCWNGWWRDNSKLSWMRVIFWTHFSPASDPGMVLNLPWSPCMMTCAGRETGSASLLVLLDLSAAFNTIDHGILLDRLAGLGVGGTAWQWFRSYLNGRFQKVVLGDFGSAPWQLFHGVLQGSILSPLLFNIYMKLLGEVIRRCGLQNHQYTDDTQLYLSFSTNPGEAVAVLNWCLAEVLCWMKANKLKLNPDKTEVLLVGGSSSWVGDLDLVLNGVALPLKDKVHS
uniref:Reverse transcriptase domain-containing protein n=1 Tax=Varanus komodoensis TaxID=61221 RepID=A0A8D2PYI1_VARKO